MLGKSFPTDSQTHPGVCVKWPYRTLPYVRSVIFTWSSNFVEATCLPDFTRWSNFKRTTNRSLLLVSHPAVNQFAYQRHSITYATLILPNDFKQLSVYFPVIIYKKAFLIYDTTFHSANSHYALSIPLSFTKTDERKTFWVGNLTAPSNSSRARNRI